MPSLRPPARRGRWVQPLAPSLAYRLLEGCPLVCFPDRNICLKTRADYRMPGLSSFPILGDQSLLAGLLSKPGSILYPTHCSAPPSHRIFKLWVFSAALSKITCPCPHEALSLTEKIRKLAIKTLCQGHKKCRWYDLP